MGSFNDYINKKNTSKGVSTSGSSSSSFASYHERRQKEREEQEEEEKRRKQYEKIASSSNFVSKAKERLQPELTKEGRLPKAKEYNKAQEEVELLASDVSGRDFERSVQKRMGILTPLAKYAPKSGAIGMMYTGVTAEPSKEDKNKEGFFKGSDVFSDGYQIGDIHKVGEATLSDAASNLLKGFVGVGESSAEGLTGAMADEFDLKANVLRKLGREEEANKLSGLANNMRNEIKAGSARWATKGIDNALPTATYKNSLLGQKSNQVLQGVGQTIGYAGLSEINPVVGTAGMSASAAGNEFYQGLNDPTMTLNQVRAKAYTSAVIEPLTEHLFGFFGTTGLDTKAANYLANKTSSQVGQFLIRRGVNSLSEGAEEVISYSAQQVADRAIDYVNEKTGGDGRALSEPWNYEEIWDEALSAAISAGLTGAGSDTINLANTYDTNQSLNQNVNDFIANENLSAELGTLNEEKEGIENKIKKTKNSEKVQKLLERLKNVNSQIQEKQSQFAPSVNEARANNQVQEVQELPVVDKKKSILTKVPDGLVKSAKQYNLNYKNSNLLEIQKSLENKGIKTRFDENEFTNENEGAKWKLTRNEDGTVTREIILNPKANEKTVIQEMAIHELTHDIVAKNTDTSNKLYNEVKTWLEKDSSYQEQLESLKEIYGEKFAEEEAIAKTLQTKFGSQEEINHLVKYNPSKARIIYDWIVDKLNKITGGKIERLYWEDVRNKFERAYSEEGNYSNENSLEKYYFANVDYFDEMEYNNSTSERVDSKTWKAIDDSIGRENLKPGIYETEAFDYTDDQWKRYTIYYKNKGEYKIVNSQNINENNYTEGANSGINKYSKATNTSNDTTESTKKYYTGNNGKAYNEGTAENISELSNQNEKYSDTNRKVDTQIDRNKQNLENSSESSFNLPKNVKEIKNLNQFLREMTEKETDKYWKDQLMEAKHAGDTGWMRRESPLHWKRRLVQQYLDYKNNTESRYSISTDGKMQDENTTTDNQGEKINPGIQEWAKNSYAREGNSLDGKLKHLYHGTNTGEFYTFDENRFNPESDWGSGIYLTDSEYDVNANYTGGGTDFDNKISRLAEQIEQDEDISYEEAKEKARQQLEKGAYLIDAYAKITNPAIVGETRLFEINNEDLDIDRADYETDEDYEDALLYAQDDAMAEQIEDALSEIRQYYDISYEEDNIKGILEEAAWNGGIEIQNLKDRLNEKFIEVYDDNGNLATNDIARLIIQSQGYDGIIDNTVSSKWNGMDMEPDTTHYIVFNSNQVKDINNENPTDNPDIRYSNNVNFDQYLENRIGKKGTRTELRDLKLVENPYNSNDNSIKTATTENEQEEIAQILEEPVKKEKEKSRAWAIAKANILDKGIVFEELSRKTNNRELQGKWDYTLTSGARGQNAIGNARYEMNTETKTEKQISKSLEDIREEVGKNTSQFQNYMYHLLNIDRMTLQDRYGTENKPVFGDNISAEYSKQKVAEFEKQYPEFKEYAQDVYDFLDANKQELVDRGVISQELSDKLKEIYPHYVPIKRVDAKGLAIKVPLDTFRTGVNTPLQRAKGGSSDIQPLFQTIADRTLQTYNASARNSFGVELMNTLNSQIESEQADVDSIIEQIGNEDTELLKEGKNGQNPTFTVFDNGNKVTFEITKDMYDALKPQSDVIKNINNSKLAKVGRTISNIRRGVLTEYNPVFSLTNAIKDAQDVVANSQHPLKTYKKFGEAYAQILNQGYWYNEYVQNGGEQNSYFRDGEFTSDKKQSKLKSAITIPFEKISQVNNVVEMAPRLAEYIASREAGRSIETSMLDAARVTTNFKAGGDWTKTLNRNGATFLNASVQGFQQQIRNIQEAHAKGLKGYAVLATKYVILGLPAIILNNLVWKDDEDYKNLQDYAKDNYYIIGKYGDGKFIRIPKGRVAATVQKVVSNISEYVTDDEKELNIDNFAKDFWEDIKFAQDNVAPNNPLSNNVISPVLDVINNKTWYGGDMIPKRLQDKPAKEQYDETTDKLSIWLGNKLNVSPYKINYLLDQYGGGVSDIVLPKLTKQAENNVLEDKFTTDSVMKNKYPGEFYDKLDELKVNSNSYEATDEDILKYKYMSSVSSEMSKLYQEKRDIQNSNISDKQKKEQLKVVQEKINKLAQSSLQNAKNIDLSENTASIGDEQYYKKISGDETTWSKLTDKEKEKNKNISLETYSDYKNKIAEQTKDGGQLKTSEKIDILLNSKYSKKEKAALYENYIDTDDLKYQLLKTANIDIDKYLQYKNYKGTKKDEIYDYIFNDMKGLTYTQKILLYGYGASYKLPDEQLNYVKNYVNNLKISNAEKQEILKHFK